MRRLRFLFAYCQPGQPGDFFYIVYGQGHLDLGFIETSLIEYHKHLYGRIPSRFFITLEAMTCLVF
jgi:hypothetical protein